MIQNAAHDQPLYYPDAFGPVESPIVRASEALARLLHLQQWRKKANADLQYISHPVLAMNILRAHHVNDPQVLAAALLHDTIEDCSVPLLKYAMEKLHYDPMSREQAPEMEHAVRYDVFPENVILQFAEQMPVDIKALALENWLQEEIMAEYTSSDGYDQPVARYMASNAANEIVEIVKELTNKTPQQARLDSKRFFQADKTHTYSREAKRVKMAEMAASMADDIMHEPLMEAEKSQRFYNRCWTMAKGCGDAMPELFRLVRSLYEEATRVNHDPSCRVSASDFSLQAHMEQAKTMPDIGNRCHTSQWVDNDHPDAQGKMNFEKIKRGLLSVGLDDQGRVVCFRMLCNRADAGHLGQDDPVNHTAEALMDKLEAEENVFVSISRMKVFHDRRYGRKMELTAPVELERFIADAKQAGAIDTVFTATLREKAAAMTEAAPTTLIASPPEGTQTVNSAARRGMGGN